ncbi:MAG TPA: tetratricopeptide repeat protein [Candidatus Acidoferrales bacterium]|nr:tetratricopeptide repeat protein [Candidatus Acidoferrales bacterium]
MRNALNRRIACVFAFATLILVAVSARAGDDTARFYGTWKTTVVLNGQSVTIISVHDASGYKNYARTATGEAPAGDGTFTAANGKWSSNAAAPNNGGVYHFVSNDIVIATNSAGQTVTWTRDKSAEAAAAKGPTPVDANTAANRTTGYVPPNGRPGNSVTPPAAQPSQPAALPAPATAESPADASLSPNVKAGFAALKGGDRVTAWRDFMTDAQKGNSDAEAAIGSMLFQNINPPGTGFYKDCEKWLLASAKQDNAHGMDMLAQFYYNDGKNMAGGINPGVNNSPLSPDGQRLADAKFALARQWFEKSAAKGDLYAMGNLAPMLDAGLGGPRDPNRAAQLRAQVQKGPDANFAHRATADPASQALTAAWQSGHYADAIKSAEAGAAKGDASAEALLGRAYYEGLGVPRNYATAATWLNKAVAQNNANAMFFLGLMKEFGRGVPQNLNEALDLFDRAAALGQGYAKMEAAGMRMQGEINRQAAKMHGGGVMERACETAGGIPDSAGLCMKGGGTIDPFNAEEAAGSGYESSAPEPVYQPEPEQ